MAAKTKAKRKAKPLTRAQMRVRIAKDVIAQLASRRLVAKRDAYLRFKKPKEVAADARKVLADRTCTACAIGSLAVAACRRFDKVTSEELLSSYDVGGNGMEHSRHALVSFLAPWFTEEELCAAEDAFESDHHRFVNSDIRGAKAKLTALMRGIVAAKGKTGALIGVADKLFCYDDSSEAEL